MRRWAAALVAVAAAMTATVPASPASATGDATVRWSSFSESSGCGLPYTRTPQASRSGSLANSEPILGPFGGYFGRSIEEVRDHLVWWTVPMSGGKKVLVHEAAYPAFQQVAANLAAEEARGRFYQVDYASGFVARTIGGIEQMSRHALGLAVDINSPRNPYRADNKLITDMPDWFVDAWRKAGFCWGGDWVSIKDPMHFSWMGPAATPDYGTALDPLPADVDARAYRVAAGPLATVYGPAGLTGAVLVADGTGNGAPDVIRVRDHEGGSVLDISRARYGYGQCSLDRWFVSGFEATDLTLMADLDGDSRQDLISLDLSSGTVSVETATRAGWFGDTATVATPIPASDVVAVAAGDFDGDRRADLWVARSDGTLEVWANGWQDRLGTWTLPTGRPRFLAVADREDDAEPELFVFAPGGQDTVSVLRLAAGSWTVSETAGLPVAADDLVAVAATDYDGEGHADLVVVDTSGAVTVSVGNGPTGRPLDGWFAATDQTCSDPLPATWSGPFFDDDTSIFQADIEAIAALGITKGCNPPYNDRFCPDDRVTRGQMAAFLVRALSLPAADRDWFVDDAGSIFEDDINRLAAAGITKGCNPPANDRFCPDQEVTRAQMAAFLVRAYRYPDPGAPDVFIDDDGSTFEHDIARLAAAGITKGCNPPTNDRYCPSDPVTRGQMAAFLFRASR